MKKIALIFASVIFVFGCQSPIGTSQFSGTQDSRALSAVVANNGALKVSGNKIVNKNNAATQLRGMSLFWSQWSTPFWNASTINYLASTVKVDIVRAAMGAQQGTGGYLDGATQKTQATNQVTTVVDAAIAAGIYVIIDWHEEQAVQHTQQAGDFFVAMANKYKNSPNVIFEIYNEPNGPSWSQIKAYANTVIGRIRATGANNLVVVGTPTWSQDVDLAAADPITAYSNVAYTLHFYAGTHRDSLRAKATTALNKGIALFATEWGVCDASGNGGVDLTESQKWIDFLASNKISWCNWSLNDKAESASALNPGTSPTGPYKASNLTQSGAWVFPRIHGFAGEGGGTSTGTTTGTTTGTSTGTTTGTSTGTSTGSGSVTATVTNDWGSGFTEDIKISNKGTTSINGWQVDFDLPHQIVNLWNGTYTVSGTHYTVKNASFNASIPSGSSVTFGFQANKGSSSVITPTNIVLRSNGVILK